MFGQSGYRAALGLTALIALLNGSYFIYAKLVMPHTSYGAAIYVVGSVLILVGLWLQSRIARYAGAAYYLFVAGAAVYGLSRLSKPIINVGIVWIVTAAVLGLVAASTLVLSNSFAREFAAEREKRPAYKKLFLNVYIALIALATAVATWNDIANLISS